MTVAATSKRDSWVNRAWYVQPETANRLKSYVNRQQENGINIDASDVVNEALAAFLSNNAVTASEPASELADLVDLVVSLKNDVEELQKWRKSQTPKKDRWIDDLRLRIRRECGRGWIIDAVGKTKLNPNGKCRLSKIALDRSRTSVVLPHDWLPENADEILGDAIHIHECLMANVGMNIKDGLATRWRGVTVAK